ncbi:type II secretion system protein N [Aestuariibacter sp. AA17]|uniref:Type II secretion system protein N n=1 Tax=Fluctibacter corallii TaxID=2984329 RepID=A0ABT3AAV6_9ALTE|nr:type II secretion system protein N [Aestuariibacter sp. AA17]MCV2885810.1 type II secretion system protein N [Aestuariibacter sp. AA17]
MKNTLTLSLVAVLAYLFFLVANLPANQILGRIKQNPSVALYGVSGTLWEGHANTLVVQGLPIDDVSWDISVWKLLIGKLSIDIDAGNSRDNTAISLKGPISINVFNPQHITAQDLTLFLPTDLVIAKLPLPVPVNAGGRFKLQLDEMDYDQQCHTLSGNGQWLKATVAGAKGPISLGNFDASIACDNGEILVNVSEPNAFGLSATARVPVNLNVRVEGRFKPQESLPPEVHQAAKFFGQPDSEGYYNVKL